MRRSVPFGRFLILAIACLALVTAACSSSKEPKSSDQPTSERSGEADAGPTEADSGSTDGDAGSMEANAGMSGEPGAEWGEGDADRIERTGIAPRTGPLDRAPANGWAGETLFGHGNDWEPNVAADPSGPFVYMVTTRYSGHPACPTCTKYPYIALKISKDDGQTFGRRQYLCPCPGRTGGQYDPQIEADAHGDVYAAWINGGFRVVESRSTDHGKTWSTPNVVTHGGPGWSDHPWLAVSPRGKDVYIAYNHQDSYIAQSHDFGRTWEKPVKTNAQHRYHYAGGGYVFPNGDVVFSQANYPLGKGYAGPVHIVATWSHDGGKTWHTTQVDSVGVQPPCVDNRGCPKQPPRRTREPGGRRTGRSPDRLRRRGLRQGTAVRLRPPLHRRWKDVGPAHAPLPGRQGDRDDADGDRNRQGRLRRLVLRRAERATRVERLVPEHHRRGPHVGSGRPHLGRARRRRVQERARVRSRLRGLR
jgi:hypothetical protein